MGGFWSENEYFGFENIFKYENEKVILNKQTIVEEQAAKTIYNWLQYFDRGQLSAEFNQAGFKNLSFYDDVAGSEYSNEKTEFAIVAQKK